MGLQTDFFKKLGVERKEAVLQNGLRVVLYERPNMPVSVRAVFAAGSRYDPKGKEGLAHFVEHMIVAGTESYPSKDLLAQFIEQYGGMFGAMTNSGSLNVDLHVSEPADLPKLGHLLDEMLNKSVLSQNVFDTERGSVLRELGNRLSSPAGSLWLSYYNLFYQGSQIARPTLGTAESIEAIKLNDVKDFINNYLTLERMTLFIVGDVSLGDVKNVFEPIAFRSAKTQVVEVPRPAFERNRTVEIRDFKINDQIDFMVGFRTCGFNDADSSALYVIRELLGGGRASTFSRRLRYENGYIYSGSATCLLFKDDGAWLFQTACSKKDFQKVLDIIASEVKRVYGGELASEEVSFAKEKIIKSLRINLQSTSAWVNNFANEESQASQTLNDYANGISNVTQEDLARVGKKYFGPDSWYLVAAGDISEKEIAFNF